MDFTEKNILKYKIVRRLNEQDNLCDPSPLGCPRWGSNLVENSLEISDYIGRQCLLCGSAYSASCRLSGGGFMVNLMGNHPGLQSEVQ